MMQPYERLAFTSLKVCKEPKRADFIKVTYGYMINALVTRYFMGGEVESP